jgi:hypothetical protein
VGPQTVPGFVLVVAPDVRMSGGVGMTSDACRQPLVNRSSFFEFLFHFFKKNEKKNFFSENRATRRKRRHSIDLPYTTGGIHRQNKTLCQIELRGVHLKLVYYNGVSVYTIVVVVVVWLFIGTQKRIVTLHSALVGSRRDGHTTRTV